MSTVQTKKNEVVRTITTSEALAGTSGMFISEAVCKKWTEEFVDEDSGEVVSIDRKEVLYDKGRDITPALISEMLFNLQAGEITEIKVSNQRRASYEANYGSRIYLATVEIGPKQKKNKFLFSAGNIPLAIETLKDYIELNFIGGYRIISIKEFQTSLILDDKLKETSELNSDESALNEDKFYQITAIVTRDDGFEHKVNVVVKTLDLDKAIILLNRRLEEGSPDGTKLTSRLEEAKLLTVDHIIEDEFCAAYKQ